MLNISISDVEYNKFGFRSEHLTFSDLIDLISIELSKQTLNGCVELSNRFELSKTSMDEITDEIKAAGKKYSLTNALVSV
ncbi:hypothetical protein QTN47_16760 [Danxiaibacter flavus]|uniref:Uncharacterized protein n=1 Tax=Danxiaibacter flavus TaxID=3049108 RepID=A0ABV3ZGY5_9BACT|nr:hypothetical protein QNM32_16770 [Chitinophagaceae bacterium DXS]